MHAEIAEKFGSTFLEEKFRTLKDFCKQRAHARRDAQTFCNVRPSPLAVPRVSVAPIGRSCQRSPPALGGYVVHTLGLRMRARAVLLLAILALPSSHLLAYVAPLAGAYRTVLTPR